MLTLDVAQMIVATALGFGRAAGMRPLTVVVLDARAAVMAVASEDGSSLKRFEIAQGKAAGALAFNVGSRALGQMAVDRPHFMAGAAHVVGGLIPVPGGVLIRADDRRVLGAVGISGDTSDNDEAAAMAAIVAVGLLPDGG